VIPREGVESHFQVHLVEHFRLFNVIPREGVESEGGRAAPDGRLNLKRVIPREGVESSGAPYLRFSRS
jgi:hypothetical protein